MSENRQFFDDYPAPPPEPPASPRPRREVRPPGSAPVDAEPPPRRVHRPPGPAPTTSMRDVEPITEAYTSFDDYPTSPPHEEHHDIQSPHRRVPPSTLATPLWGNESVREAHTLLSENNMTDDAHHLSELVNQVNVLESHIESCEDALEAMRSQLATVRALQGSALRNTLGNAVQKKEHDIAETKGLIASIKGSISNGCKNIVTAFKETGVLARDRIAQIFGTKERYIRIEANAQSAIDVNEKLVNKIETFSKQFRQARTAIRNMGRAIIGKAPIDMDAKVGKLANLLCRPYRDEIHHQTKIRDAARSSIRICEAKEDRANAIRAKRAEKRTAKRDKTRSPSQKDKIESAKKEAATHNEQSTSRSTRTRARDGGAK